MAISRNVIFFFCALIVRSQAELMKDDATTIRACTTPEGSTGDCVSISDCLSLLDTLASLKSGASADAYLESIECNSESDDSKNGLKEVCCTREGFSTLPPASPPVMTRLYMLPPASVGEWHYADDFCGGSNNSFTKIVGGINAKLGDFPWMALLGYTSPDEVENDEPEWRCGGALVSPYHIVTAAHCMDGQLGDRLYVVRLGELDLASDADGATPTDYRIARKVVHPEYGAAAHVNDIAVLTLQEKVTFSKFILPICLPLSQELRNDDFVDYNPFVAGWGNLKYQGPRATKLQKLQVPVHPNSKCQQAYGEYDSVVIDERIICAGLTDGGHNSCHGDSGGPLMLPRFNPETRHFLWYLIGVVSYSVKCAEPGYPDVYVRVPAYIPWIQEQMVQ